MRLVTRADLDGLTCAVIITSSEKIDEIALVHPQDITDKRFAVKSDDIIANLPFTPCGKWFDHHILTDNNQFPRVKFEGRYDLAPSAARIVYEYYLPQNPDLKRYEALVSDTDRLDSAQLNIDDVLYPKGYILLGLTLDSRSGLGAYREYFMQLVDALKTLTIDEILALPEVQEKELRMAEQDAKFKETTLVNSRLDGNVVFTDFRDVSPMPIGNRFIVYTLFPQANVQLRVHWGPGKLQVVAAVGHSIFNRTSLTNVGILMSAHGGGGHKGAGTCLLPAETADLKLSEIIAALKKDG